MANIELTGLGDLIQTQICFQKRLGNNVPDDIVEFEHVQTSISHNVYQSIEFQEFLEADSLDRQEELIDYLLFLFNKYIYLGLDPSRFNGQPLLGLLYDEHKTGILSHGSAASIANLEQNDYITLLRYYCTFKPWKAKTGKECTNKEKVHESFIRAISYFKYLANTTYNSYFEFNCHLERKLGINIDRQNNGY